mgnify:CR=1 FL=1
MTIYCMKKFFENSKKTSMKKRDGQAETGVRRSCAGSANLHIQSSQPITRATKKPMPKRAGPDPKSLLECPEIKVARSVYAGIRRVGWTPPTSGSRRASYASLMLTHSTPKTMWTSQSCMMRMRMKQQNFQIEITLINFQACYIFAISWPFD